MQSLLPYISDPEVTVTKVESKTVLTFHFRIRAFHRGGDGDKLSPSWVRGGKSSPPPELVRSTHECCITELYNVRLSINQR